MPCRMSVFSGRKRGNPVTRKQGKLLLDVFSSGGAKRVFAWRPFAPLHDLCDVSLSAMCCVFAWRVENRHAKTQKIQLNYMQNLFQNGVYLLIMSEVRLVGAVISYDHSACSKQNPGQKCIVKLSWHHIIVRQLASSVVVSFLCA